MMMTLIFSACFNVIISDITIWVKKYIRLEYILGYMNFNFYNIPKFNGPLTRTNCYGITLIDCLDWILMELADIRSWLNLVGLTLT